MYAQTLDLQVVISFENRNECAVNKIRYHVSEIKKHLDLLAHLAGKDEKILEGVVKTFTDVLQNILGIFAENAKKLDSHRKRLKPASMQIIPFRSEADKKEPAEAMA